MTKSVTLSVLLLCGMVLLTTQSCKKDLVEPTFAGDPTSSPFRQCKWTEKEKRFFSLSNHSSGSVNDRNGTGGIFHYRLVNAYNTIAQQNELEDFVENIYDNVGTPLWAEAFVYSHHSVETNIVLIPLVKDGLSRISGVISAYEKPNGEIVLEGMTREEMVDTTSGVLTQKLGYLNWVVPWEQRLFGQVSPGLIEPLCDLKEKYNLNLLPPPPTTPCQGFWLDLCFVPGTETFWFGRLNAPPHLDHDHDGIPNDEDQDFADLGITQQEFEDRFYDWWEDNMEDEYGDYDDFYDDYYSGYDDLGSGGGGIFNEDFWIDLEDMWADIEDWFHDVFQDIGGWFDDWDDIFDEGPQCWLGGPLDGGVGDRNFVCDWFWVYDTDCLPHPWWMFPEGINEAWTLRYRLHNYWEANNMESRISFSCFEAIVVDAGCDPFQADNPSQFGFETCAQSALEEREEDLEWLMNHHNVPQWFTLKDYLEATCNCPFNVDFQQCASNSLFQEIANRVSSDLSGLSDQDLQEMLTGVWNFQETYELRPESFEMFDELVEVAVNNGCINANSTVEFEICLADAVFVKEGVATNDPNIIQDLVLQLQNCFVIGGNTGPGFSHHITLYADQPKANSSDTWSVAELVGHCFIGLKQEMSNGEIRSQVFGFYPADLAKPTTPEKPGAFKDDGGHDYDVSITWNISGQNFNTIIAAIENNISSFTTYNLNENSCTDFVLMACNSINLGINPPTDTWPKVSTSPLSIEQNEGYSPAVLGEYMRTIFLVEPFMSRDANGGFADASFCN